MSKRLLKFYIKKYIHLIPITMILATLLSNFIELNYVLVGNILGYSILSNIVMWCFFNFNNDYCWFTRNITSGLIIMNIIDVVGCYLDYDYYSNFFNITICSVTLILFLIFEIKKLQNDKSSNSLRP